MIVSPPVVDTILFKPQRQRQFLEDGTLRLIMNARYVPYKRHDLLLRVVHRLREEGRKVEVTFIGRDSEGKERIAQYVTMLELEGSVTFMSSVPKQHISTLVGQHDLLVLPSYNEALGMVVPEAMASGTPTVTSDTVGANVYVASGDTGLIFATDDADDLYRTLVRCFDHSLLVRLGNGARERIEALHAVTKHKDRLAHIIVSPYAEA